MLTAKTWTCYFLFCDSHILENVWKGFNPTNIEFSPPVLPPVVIQSLLALLHTSQQPDRHKEKRRAASPLFPLCLPAVNPSSTTTSLFPLARRNPTTITGCSLSNLHSFPSVSPLRSHLFVVIATTVSTRSYAKKARKMPPKKAVKEEKILLGRPGNNLKSGIVRSFPFDG